MENNKLRAGNLLSTEARILLSGAQLSPSAAEEAFLREVISRRLDWGNLLYLGAHHRVAPLVWRTIKRLGLCGRVPKGVRRLLENECIGVRERNIFFFAEMDRINGRFLESGVKIALLKGGALAPLVYKDIALREVGDVDYLVHPKDIPRVLEILGALGYQQGHYDLDSRQIVPAIQEEKIKRRIYSHELVEHLKLTDNCYCPVFEVDINFALFWKGDGRSSRFSLDTEEVLENIELVRLSGSMGYSLRPEYQVIQLCAHLYSEAVYFCWDLDWARDLSDLNLIKFCDLHELLQARDINWSGLRELLVRYKVEEPVYYALASLDRLFERSVPSAFLSKLDVDPGVIDLFFDKQGKRVKWEASFEERMFDPAGRLSELRSRGLL